jgi:hypothetical protein
VPLKEEMTMIKLHRIPLLFAVASLVLAVAACALTRSPRERAEPSGFLGDYSQLREGMDDEADFVYTNPDVDWSRYDAILIESVAVWHRGSEQVEISEAEAEALATYLYNALHQELGKDYQIAERSGSGVMRLRAAITEAEGANRAGKAITSVIPQLRTLSTLGGMGADMAVVVGEAAIEVDLRDSETDERLMAAVDERWGTKALRAGFSEWGDVEHAYDFWAKRIRERLTELRNGGS